MAPNIPISDGDAKSRTAAIRLTRGATCVSDSAHFPAIEYSKLTNPVILPPSRDRLSTTPAPTGSRTCVSFDHLVGAGEQCGWDFEAELPGSFEIDNQLESGGLHNGQLGWFGSLENATGINAN